MYFCSCPLPSTIQPACLLSQTGVHKEACIYEQRVREVEHSSFTTLVLSATGGMANEATTFYKRLASCLALKWDYPYSSTMSWLRCRLTFSLLRSAIQCIRGARSSCGHATKSPPPIDLVISELQCPNYLTHLTHSHLSTLSIHCIIFIPIGTILSLLACLCTMCDSNIIFHLEKKEIFFCYIRASSWSNPSPAVQPVLARLGRWVRVGSLSYDTPTLSHIYIHVQ